MNSPLQQQMSFGYYGAPKRQPSPQHGQKAEAQSPLKLPRSWEPRPGR